MVRGQAGTAQRKQEQGNGQDDPIMVSAAATLKLGRVRDAVRDAWIEAWKTRPKPWDKLTQEEQENLIDRGEFLAGALVNEVARIIKADGTENIMVCVDEFAANKSKRTIKLKGSVVVPFLSEASAFLLREEAGTYLLVPCDPAKFHGESKKRRPDVVGSLRMPAGKTAESDPAAEAKLGRGPIPKGQEMPGDIGPASPPPPNPDTPEPPTPH